MVFIVVLGVEEIKECRSDDSAGECNIDESGGSRILTGVLSCFVVLSSVEAVTVAVTDIFNLNLLLLF